MKNDDGIYLVKECADSSKTDFMLLWEFLMCDVGINASKFKPSLERVFSGEDDGFGTNELDVDRVDKETVKFTYGYGDIEDDESGLFLKKDQLYYLMDEWARLVKAHVNEITISYDDTNDTYTISGK